MKGLVGKSELALFNGPCPIVHFEDFKWKDNHQYVYDHYADFEVTTHHAKDDHYLNQHITFINEIMIILMLTMITVITMITMI